MALLSGAARRDAGVSSALYCIWPGDESITSLADLAPLYDLGGAAPPRHEIATQCCSAAGECRRRATAAGAASKDNSDCISGRSGVGVGLMPSSYPAARTT